MRTLFGQMMVSLDGFMEGLNRELDWHVTDGHFNHYVILYYRPRPGRSSTESGRAVDR